MRRVRKSGAAGTIPTRADHVSSSTWKTLRGSSEALQIEVADREQAGQELHRQNVFLRNVIDSLNYPFYVINADDYTVKMANKAAVGTEALEDGTTCHQLIRGLAEPCESSGLKCPIQEVRRTKRAVTVEHAHSDTDGNERLFEVRGYPVLDENDEVRRIIEYSLDVTKRKRAEEHTRSLNEELRTIKKELVDYRAQTRSLTSELSLVEERERKRVAQGLHDNIIQPLFFLDIKLKSLAESGADSQLADSLDEMRTVIAELIRDTRSFTFDLSYPVLYELGLEAATKQWLATEVQEKHGLRTVFKDDGRSKPLTEDKRAVLFKAVKELLINVVKHANASRVEVSISRQGGDIAIAVQDDGVGFSVREKAEHSGELKGFGLFSIRDRLTHLGGTIDIESEPDSGTRVAIMMPLEDECLL